jgi:hypothetical protein
MQATVNTKHYNIDLSSENIHTKTLIVIYCLWRKLGILN